MIGRGWWIRRRRRSQRFELKPRHLAMVFCPIAVLVHSLLWWDFGLPWYDATTFEGYAKLTYLCAERPFIRPDTRTIDGRPPRGDGIFGSGTSGAELELPPWDGINLFGGEYLPGEEAQPEYVAQLSHASVDGGTGYVFDDHRIYHVNYCNDAEFSSPLDEPEWPEVSTHARLATIAGKHSGHYFHWFAEELPRLLILEEFFAARAQARGDLALQDDDIKLLLPAHTEASHGFIRESLRHLGLPPSRVISAAAGTRYYAQELFVPTMTCLGRPSREMAERVRARFAPTKFGGPKRRRIILIEKHHHSAVASYDGGLLGAVGAGNAPAVSNYQELKARLAYEFPEDEVSSYDGSISLSQTIELFSTARVIIGPHGAGLVNMLFAPNDTAVVELQRPSLSVDAIGQPSSSSSIGSEIGFAGVAGAGNRAPNVNYWHLAAALGLEHWTLFASPDREAAQLDAASSSASMHAAVNPVLQVVEDILLRSAGKAGPRRPMVAGLLRGKSAEDGAQATLLGLLATDPDDTSAGSANTVAAAEENGEGSAIVNEVTEKHLRSALSKHAHKLDGVGDHVMVIRADDLTLTSAAAMGREAMVGAEGEQGIPWCRPTQEEHATEHAIAKEVRCSQPVLGILLSLTRMCAHDLSTN